MTVRVSLTVCSMLLQYARSLDHAGYPDTPGYPGSPDASARLALQAATIHVVTLCKQPSCDTCGDLLTVLSSAKHQIPGPQSSAGVVRAESMAPPGELSW